MQLYQRSLRGLAGADHQIGELHVLKNRGEGRGKPLLKARSKEQKENLWRTPEKISGSIQSCIILWNLCNVLLCRCQNYKKQKPSNSFRFISIWGSKRGRNIFKTLTFSVISALRLPPNPFIQHDIKPCQTSSSNIQNVNPKKKKQINCPAPPLLPHLFPIIQPSSFAGLQTQSFGVAPQLRHTP